MGGVTTSTPVPSYDFLTNHPRYFFFCFFNYATKVLLFSDIAKFFEKKMLFYLIL